VVLVVLARRGHEPADEPRSDHTAGKA
jgi:hypothetical protein